MNKIEKYLTDGLEKYSDESAKERYTYNEKEISKLLKSLTTTLKKFKKDFVKEGSTNWGYVGSLSYVKDKLEDITRHFGK